MKNIKTIIENELGIDDLFKKCRKREYVEARSVYDKAMRMFSNKTVERIGLETNRTHASVTNSFNNFEVHSMYNKKLASVYEKVIFVLKESMFIVNEVDLKRNRIVYL